MTVCNSALVNRKAPFSFELNQSLNKSEATSIQSIRMPNLDELKIKKKKK